MPWGAVAGAVIGAYGANKAAKKQSAAADRNADKAYEQSLPWSMQGMFGGASFDEEGRMAYTELSPEMQEQYNAMMERSRGYADQISQFDSGQMQEDFYQEQKALSEPGEQQDRLAMENRLYAQGMLGSSGGEGRMRGLQTAQSMKDLARRAEARSASEAQLDRIRGRQSSDFGAALQIGALPMDYANLGRGIGSGMSGAAQSGAAMRNTAAQNAADTTAGFWSQLGQTVGSYGQDNKYEQWYKAKQKYGS